ncbi:MAG: hypothetical protein AB7J86_16385 [Vulcanimicrobiota bacterium]
MKKKYRFEIDLREPKPAPQVDGVTLSGAEPSPAPKPQYRELQVTPEVEAAYQKLVAQVEKARRGRTASEHVFVTSGSKHLLFRQADESVGELRLSDDGSLVRRVYERLGGEIQSLDDLYEVGLSGLDADRHRFAQFPGYELRFTRYDARRGKLQRVRMGMAVYQDGQIVIRAF